MSYQCGRGKTSNTKDELSMPFFPPLEINGKKFDFLHLEPIKLLIESASANKTLIAHVTFSNHCFSRCLDDNECLEGLLSIPSDYKARVFCETRYNLSFKLPEIIKELNNPSVKVFQTASRRNWTHSISVDSPSGKYHVFFEVKNATKDQKRTQDLNIFVESAYPQDPNKPKPQVLGRMKFGMLCTNTYLGKKLSTRR